jgi:tetratricopeptide (TPR) repeat protein
MIAQLRFAVGLLLSCALASPALADDDWTGQIVILKGDKTVHLTRPTKEGKWMNLAELDFLHYRVLKDEGAKLRIRQHGVEGLFDKSDAVLAKEALKHFSERILKDDKDAAAYARRACAWTLQEKPALDFAIKDYTKAIELEPKDASFYNNRGAVLYAMKEYKKALEDFAAAYALDPKHLSANNNIAWVLATCPDPKLRNGARAVEHATTACELSNRKEATCYGTLAAACAEAGLFEDAVKYQTQALTDPDYDQAYGKEARQRLELYKQKKPYHQSK